MSACVACNKPLEVEIELEDEEDYEIGASSSSGKAPAANPETVPDDVQLSCGCHFHWYVALQFSAFPYSHVKIGIAYSKPIK